MLNVTIKRIIDDLKITPSDKKEVYRLLERPEVQEIINADQADRVERRANLVKELRALDPEKKRTKLEKETVVALAKFQDLEKEYYLAKQALSVAQLACHYASNGDDLRKLAIERELTAGADPRIAEYRFFIGCITGRVRSKIEFWQSSGAENWLGKSEITYQSNADDVANAQISLDKALCDLRDFELSAMTSDQITNSLKSVSKHLSGPLAALGMHAPTIDADDKVVAPKRDGERHIEQTQSELTN